MLPTKSVQMDTCVDWVLINLYSSPENICRALLYPAALRRWHDDLMTWKHCLHYLPFVSGIHPWPVTLHKVQIMQSFDVFFDAIPNKLLHKQSGYRWFKT